MIYTSHALNSKIDSVQAYADNDRKSNPARSTFEDGFADGLSHVLPTVEKLEQDVRDLTALLEDILDDAFSSYTDEIENVWYRSDLDHRFVERGNALLQRMKS